MTNYDRRFLTRAGIEPFADQELLRAMLHCSRLKHDRDMWRGLFWTLLIGGIVLVLIDVFG